MIAPSPSDMLSIFAIKDRLLALDAENAKLRAVVDVAKRLKVMLWNNVTMGPELMDLWKELRDALAALDKKE